MADLRAKARAAGKRVSGSQRISGERILDIFHKSPVMVYMTDLEGTFLEINRAGVELLGYGSREEIVGAVSSKTIYAEPAERFRFRDIIFRDGSVREFITKLRRTDGEIRDVAITSTARRDEKGEISGYEGFVVDITDRKRAEAALRESEEKYRNVVENCLAGIFVHQKGILQYVNPRCLEFLGYGKPEEMTGRPFWEFVFPDDREFVKDRGLRREKGYVFPPQYVFRLLKKDGSMVWVDMRAAKVTYMERPAVVGNLYDITAGKKAEEQIRYLSRKLIDIIEEQQKMLAADLHDEFGQALTAIHFGLEALQ
ncbi:MAG: PAS domain S-box protein, partial [Syntrophales bacterium]|nr:PAS domain S-box protein [Syntrophales bacterium]